MEKITETMADYLEIIFDRRALMNAEILAALRKFSAATGMKNESIEIIFGDDLNGQFYYIGVNSMCALGKYGGDIEKVRT